MPLHLPPFLLFRTETQMQHCAPNRCEKRGFSPPRFSFCVGYALDMSYR